jgi:fibro-slime domain-containing protein
MELHCQFTYQDNLTFNFTGDDDVFVFINGTQVIDLGGIHGPTNAAVNLNTLGLQPGQKYMFDLFYAERHATGSDILITTNLFTPPGYLRLYSKPDTASTDLLNGLDTVAAGVTFPIYAQVFDSLGNWVPSSDNLVSWTLTDALGNPLLSSATGASTSFTPTEAYGTAVVTATFSDPNNPGKVLTTKITLYIGPGAGTHVVIEADSLARNTRNDRPVGTINVDRTTNATVYAVVRDSFGNFVRFANNATWSTADPGVASATPLATKQWAASVAEKGFGSTTLTASEPGLTAGTAVVSATSPNSAVPVTATLLDIDGDGHLDRIDITLPDSVSLAAALPTVQQWIQSMYIVTDDGGSKVTLTAASMTADGAHTIHVVLTQNTGSTLETGWSSATITLSAAPMTTDGRALVVANIVDGAQPVVKSVCFVPTAVGDTLRVIFSEPPANANPALDVYALISVVQQNGSLIPVTAAAVAVVKLANSYLYVFAGNTLSGLDTAKAGVRAFPLELCGDIPIILNTKAVGNPFVPGVTQIPPKWRGTGDPLSGARIEVTFLRAIEPDVLNGNVRATITIYDAVGNALVDNKDMKIDSKNIADNVKLYFIWDGKTSKGSLAAPGTYLARMTVQDITRGRTQTVRMNVGIKK